MTREHVLEQLADLIVATEKPHPLRVAIDGVDAAGKTVLANDLVAPIESRGRPVIRASIDGFHRPRAERYRQGPDSPEGYYHDSFDHKLLRNVLLSPLGPGGSRLYVRRAFDFRSDSPVPAEPAEAPTNAVLVFEGVFLQRPELIDCWDLRIFVHADFEETIRRACERDIYLFGSAERVHERYVNRYIPGQRIYLESVRPRDIADIVMENNSPSHPHLVVRGEAHWSR